MTQHYFSDPICGDKHFRVVIGPAYAEARVEQEQRFLTASASCSQGCEADLALCLAALVEIGAINIEKLRAAMVLAEPVAQEAVRRRSI